MALYSTFLYGDTTLYGVLSTLTAVLPETGPSPGGNAFVIAGAALKPTQWNSLFDGVALDPTKFNDISAGTGTVTTGSPNLVLSSGAVAAGAAVVESINSWVNTQGEAQVMLSPVYTYPTVEVDLFTLTLYIDASNYSTFGIYLGTTSGSLVLRATTVMGGVTLPVYETEWTTGFSTLKILRWSTSLYFIANGEIMHVDHKFTTLAATFRLGATNNAAAYPAVSRVGAFYYRPYAVFGDRPVHDTVAVSDSRVRGLVPASWDNKRTDAAYAGYVNVAVVGTDTAGMLDAYEYYYVDRLTVVNNSQSGVKLSLISDDILKTPATSLRGLGENM